MIGIRFIMGLSFDLVVQSVSDARCCVGLAKLKDVIGNYLCEFHTMEPLMFECISRCHLLSEFLDCPKTLHLLWTIFFILIFLKIRIWS